MRINLRCKSEKFKRKHISDGVKQKLFDYQKGRCFYCGNLFSSSLNDKPFYTKNVDHLWPFSYSFNDDIENLVLACVECNTAKFNVVLDTVEEIIIYVRKKVNAKGIPLRRVFGCIRTKKIVAKVLLHEMSKQRILEDSPDYRNYTDDEIKNRLKEIELLVKLLC